ncbi:MAG: RNase adapter RapZ [Pseudomonadota bacterium]
MANTLVSDAVAQPILLVTGMSGAGKSTTLRALEDMGWEVVDNLPIRLLGPLLATPAGTDAVPIERPLAVGVDTRTRSFSADSIVRAIKRLRDQQGHDVATLFLDCAGAELDRRYSETRRRHPLAEDRPAADGIAREREILEPLRRWAEQLIDTTAFSINELQQEVRRRFALSERGGSTVNVMSFGYARGLPRNADLVFDMRFLRNPHWIEQLRNGTGLDDDVADYIRADPAYDDAMALLERLLATLIPRYQAEGKSYVTIAFGCTGGRHRSVHVAERIAAFLQETGYTPGVIHRNLTSQPQESLEGRPSSA